GRSAPAVGVGAGTPRQGERKGRLPARGTAGAEAPDLLAEGGVAEAEAVSDVLLAAALDDDGAEGLVEALGRCGRAQEEGAGRGVVHRGAPGCDRGRGGSACAGERTRAGVVYGERRLWQRNTRQTLGETWCRARRGGQRRERETGQEERQAST